MTESNAVKLLSDYLDSVYVISHSQTLVDCYKSDMKYFNKFVQSKYEKPRSNFFCNEKQSYQQI